MKKFLQSIVSVALVLAAAQPVLACGGDDHPYEPYDLKMFRLYNPAETSDNDMVENCKLWQSETSSDIPIDDIMEVIYFWSLEKLEKLEKTHYHWENAVHERNLFADWLNAHNVHFTYIMVSKYIEKFRKDMLDPWYYFYDEDIINQRLRGLAIWLDSFSFYKSFPEYNWLCQRTELQKARAYFSLKDYSALVENWTGEWSSGPEGYVKNQIAGYVAGAYLRTGHIETAKEMYGKLGDAESLLYCLKYEGHTLQGCSELEYLYQYSPDCSALKKIIQYKVDNQDERMDDLAEFVGKVVRERRCKDMAPWYYAAAFFALDDNDYAKVKRYIAKARACNPDDYLGQSLRVLEIFADAKFIPLGSEYETRLLDGIKYLSRWVESEDNNDMLKKVLLGVVCPRYVEAGKGSNAIALSYYADNLLTKLAERSGNEDLVNDLNGCRWRTYSFYLLDTQPIKYDIAFLNGTFEDAGAPLYRYLKYNVAPDRDYLCDIIGTRYLREMNYSQAKRYLSKVSLGYEQSLNTGKWLIKHNPLPWMDEFESIADGRRKLFFATKMCELERDMRAGTDSYKAVLARLKYSMGIEASFNFSWAYTRYSDAQEEDFRWAGYTEYNDSGSVPEHSVKYPEKAKRKVSRSRAEAFASVPEQTARALAHYAEMYSYMLPGQPKVYADCDDVESITMHYQTHCDSREDYRVQKN